MPVTTACDNVEAHPSSEESNPRSASDLLRCALYNVDAGLDESERKFQEGIEKNLLEVSFFPSEGRRDVTWHDLSVVGGLPGAAYEAWRTHKHLAIRPDDVWLAILTQFNFYVNKHAENMRHLFVDHEEKKILHIIVENFDAETISRRFADLIQENIKVPSMREWIKPSFSTTTTTDETAAAIIMMATMQKYFAYFADEICGIPTVTLLGERRDWVDVLRRLDFFSTFREHPELLAWCAMLQAILKRFVRTFDEPDHRHTRYFWQTMVKENPSIACGKSPYLTGWINAFCFWDTEGEPLVARQVSALVDTKEASLKSSPWDKIFDNSLKNWIRDDLSEKQRCAVRDPFGQVSLDGVPSAVARVPVHYRPLGKPPFVCDMIAGLPIHRIVDSQAVIKSSENQSKEKIGHVRDSPKNMETLKPKSRLSDCLPCFRTPTETDDDGTSSARPLPVVLPPKHSLDAEHEQKSTSDVPRTISDEVKSFEQLKGDTLQPVVCWWCVKKEDEVYGFDKNTKKMYDPWKPALTPVKPLNITPAQSGEASAPAEYMPKIMSDAHLETTEWVTAGEKTLRSRSSYSEDSIGKLKEKY